MISLSGFVWRKKMIGMFLAFVFDVKVVNNKVEYGGVCVEAPETGRMLNGLVAVGREF